MYFKMVERKFERHKPIVETIMNTSALALTSFGVLTITSGELGWTKLCMGLILVGFGGLLEFCKYYGRREALW